MVKKWGLILLLWLPIAPVALVVYYLNQYSGIDFFLRLLVSLILIFSYLSIIAIGSYFIKRQKKKGIFATSLISIFCLVGSLYFAYINIRIYHTLNQMIRTQSEVNQSLVSMTLSEINALHDLDGHLVGVLNLSDERVAEGINQFLIETKLLESNTVKTYDSPVMMVHALYNGEIDAMIIDSNFAMIFSENGGFEEIETETQILETITIVTENILTNNSDIANEPFTILLLGTNSTEEGNIHLGQVNTLILTTINLQNLSVTMTSIPRDSFVTIPCFNYTNDKLSHSHAGGTTCVVQTVEHLFDIDIPYYATLNFRGMVSLVDTIGGIEVDVPITFSEQNSRRQFGNHMITVYEGRQRLDGEQALALARHRNTLRLGDLARASHQQLVLEGIVNEILHGGTTVNDMLALLNVLGENLDTNLSLNEMTAIAQALLDLVPVITNSQSLDEVHIKNMVLSGESGWAQTMHYSFPLSVLFPFEGAIEDAKELILINLEEIEPPFNFEFYFNGFEGSWTTNWVQPIYNEPSRNQVIR